MTVEFVTGSTNQFVKKEKFLVYPKNSKAIDALSAMVGSVVLELIAANSDASYRINLRQTEPLVEVAMTKEIARQASVLALCKTLWLTSLSIL
jgi:hypothetical protein